MRWTAPGDRRGLGQILGIETAHLAERYHSVAVAHAGRRIRGRAQRREIQSTSPSESRCRFIRQGSSSMYLCSIMSHACSIVVLAYSLNWTGPIITQCTSVAVRGGNGGGGLRERCKTEEKVVNHVQENFHGTPLLVIGSKFYGQHTARTAHTLERSTDNQINTGICGSTRSTPFPSRAR